MIELGRMGADNSDCRLTVNREVQEGVLVVTLWVVPGGLAAVGVAVEGLAAVSYGVCGGVV